MRHPNTTAKEMVASGKWAKGGKRTYRHESGDEVRHDGISWLVGDKRYSSLWAARMVVENRRKS